MTRYIELTTCSENPHSRFSLGEPVFEGNLPDADPDFGGIRVDGQMVHFTDMSIPERVLKTMREGTATPARAAKFDCGTFGAMMIGASFERGRTFPFEKAIPGEVQLDKSPLLLLDDAQRARHLLIPARLKHS